MPSVRSSSPRDEGTELYLSIVTVGELCQGAERMRYRGDVRWDN
jgi:hypothetical protein